MFYRHTLAKTIPTIIAAFAFTAALADDVPKTAKAPAAAMAKLDALQGSWKATTQTIQDDGAWQEQSVNLVAIEKSFHGLLLTESETKRVSGDAASPRLKIDYTYDQYRNVYRISIVDNSWGIMDVYEGDFEDGALILTNIRSGTSFPIENGPELFFRMNMPVSGDKRVLDINLTTDEGETWQPFYRVTYTREKLH
jgi:uncharacterized protein DUF1579